MTTTAGRNIAERRMRLFFSFDEHYEHVYGEVEYGNADRSGRRRGKKRMKRKKKRWKACTYLFRRVCILCLDSSPSTVNYQGWWRQNNDAIQRRISNRLHETVDRFLAAHFSACCSAWWWWWLLLLLFDRQTVAVEPKRQFSRAINQ